MFYLVISKIKRNLISMLSILFIVCLIIYSQAVSDAVNSGLVLWVKNVVPSLFPFFIATEILCNTNFINNLGKILEKPVSKIFNVPGEGVFALIMGTISGYPSGAKIVADLKRNEVLNLEEAERLISFTNNSGPLFILGTVGASLFNNSKIGYYLLISHLISCIIVGVIFRNWKKTNIIFYSKQIIRKEKNIKLSDLGTILGNSIKNSIVTILNIGGFIVFFSVIIAMLNSSGFFEVTSKIFKFLNISSEVGNSILTGIIELTNGVKQMSLLEVSKINICIVSFLIGFGGLSVLFQVYSIISKENISIKPYFYGKILQGLISFFIMAILF